MNSVDYLLRDIPADLHARLKKLCGHLGWTMREAILRAIAQWVKEMEGKR